MEKQQLLQIIFNVLLLIAIITLIYTTMTLVKNKEIIQLDPLSYGMKIHNFTSCSCIDSDGKNWFSEKGGFVNRQGSIKEEINWSNIKVP
jgi:Cu/Zn superoxide dismutase